MPLGLGAQMGKGGIVKSIPSHVTSNLKMLHRYNTGSVVPVSDGAAYFDVSENDYIEIGTTATLRAANFSAGGWFYFNADSVGDSTAMLTSKPASSTYKGFQILKNSINNFEYRLGTGSNHSMSGSAVSTNKWYHILVTYDGTTYKAYEDGVLAQSDAQGTHVVSDDTFNIGRYYSGSSTLGAQGYICNVGYWSSALTQAQIKSIMFKNYAGLIDSEKTNLVTWWNLDVETATDGTAGSGGVKDSHGTNNGTLS